MIQKKIKCIIKRKQQCNKKGKIISIEKRLVNMKCWEGQ